MKLVFKAFKSQWIKKKKSNITLCSCSLAPITVSDSPSNLRWAETSMWVVPDTLNNQKPP